MPGTIPVTHEGVIGLYAHLRNAQDRIYTGLPSPIVLTIRMTTFPATGSLEVLVDGHPITDGVMTQGGDESRTFNIERARTIDLVLRNSPMVIGTYTISAYI